MRVRMRFYYMTIVNNDVMYHESSLICGTFGYITRWNQLTRGSYYRIIDDCKQFVITTKKLDVMIAGSYPLSDHGSITPT